METTKKEAGVRFGRLISVKAQGKNQHGQPVWLYICDCGKQTSATWASVKCGHKTSCGCYRYEQAKKKTTTHGCSNHPLYSVYRGMLQRCFNENSPVYKYYGGRGIIVCDEWKNDFTLFFVWATGHGWEKGLDIDRENNDGNYSPDNCRFVTRLVNMHNVRALQGNKSGYKNVYISKSGNRFRAKYSYMNKSVHVGYFSTPEMAHAAATTALSKLTERS